MPIATNTDSPSPKFHVPTVDISPYLADPNSLEAGKIIAEIRQACRSTGFFQVTGHGIPSSLQKEVFDAAAAFFKLPFDEKKKLDAKTTIGHRGYDVLASQSYEPDVMPDLKEGFYIGQDLPPSSPLVQKRRFFMGSNVWPPSSLLPAVQFQEPTERYYTAIYELSLTVLGLIARTLPYGPNVFDNFVANTPAAPLRLLHYPKAPPTTEKRQLGASAHTDFGAITLLLQDENPGLEVLNANTDEWVEIAPNPEAYVVNVGDMLSAWTKNEYKSSVHRVINKNPWDRYSVVFFFDGNLDCRLAPLDGSPEEEGREGLTVEGHMLRRMAESYGQAKK
ncbi:MAG: hypothetical protein Q9225_000714 [Loekoesia sp. 1 TL-2023]